MPKFVQLWHKFFRGIFIYLSILKKKHPPQPQRSARLRCFLTEPSEKQGVNEGRRIYNIIRGCVSMHICMHVNHQTNSKSKIQITNLKSKIYQKMDDSLKVILCKLFGNLTFFRLWLI